MTSWNSYITISEYKLTHALTIPQLVTGVQNGYCNETIVAYTEGLHTGLPGHYNDVPEGKHISVLISTIGHKTYAVLRTSWHPTLLAHQCKSHDALVQALKKHYQPKQPIIA